MSLQGDLNHWVTVAQLTFNFAMHIGVGSPTYCYSTEGTLTAYTDSCWCWTGVVILSLCNPSNVHRCTGSASPYISIDYYLAAIYVTDLMLYWMILVNFCSRSHHKTNTLWQIDRDQLKQKLWLYIDVMA